jgi:hypothetical protein
VYNGGMTTKKYLRVTGLIFLAVFVLHALRLFKGWDAVIGGVVVPMWASYIAIVVAGYLAYRGLKGNL